MSGPLAAAPWVDPWLVNVLMVHAQVGAAPKCRCGWSSGCSLNDVDGDRQQWAWHIAEEVEGASWATST